jgi:hypothetical protein
MTALPRPFGLAASLAVRWPKDMKKISYKGYRFPPEIIQRAIWLYLRFTLVTWEMPVVLKVSLRWRTRDRVTLGQKSP